MQIEKIEYGPEKTGLWSKIAFVLIILLSIIATIITGTVIWRITFSEASEASSPSFIKGIGKLLSSLLFILGAIIYLYVKALLQDEYVTTVE